MRVAHLIESDGPGGAERMLSELANGLQSRGCAGVAFLPAKGEGWLGRELSAFGVPIEYVHLASPLSTRFPRDLASAFSRHRIDLAHSHEFTMSVYGSAAAKLVGVPHVITMHGGRYYAERWRRRFAMRLSVAASRPVVAVSRRAATHL